MNKNKLKLVEPLKLTGQIIKIIFVPITVIGVIAGVIADWAGLWGGITNYYNVILLIISIIFFIIIVWQYFAYKNNLKKMKDALNEAKVSDSQKKVKELPQNIKRKCRVLIVDDNDTALKEIETELESGISQKKMHLVSINRIPDYRLAADFDIIISDIYGAGSGARESIGALKAIQDAFPYKIVAAISQNTDKETKSKLDIVLSKKKKNEIKDFIEASLKRLDNLEAFIKDVEHELDKRGLKNEDIEIKREEFLDFLERMKCFADN
jgi:hypothetical protein